VARIGKGFHPDAMESPKPYGDWFKELGQRYRRLRARRGMVQEDALEYGFSVRHYQQLEGGRPHSLRTLFRLARMLGVQPEQLLKGLSEDGLPRIKKRK
jgi:transcriptional regulator with XRE-family HTH domain